MPSPFFTTNDSEISRLEGLYIKERNPPAVIAGANLNTVGLVGEAVRGPVDRAISIGSEARFREVFGWRDQGSGGAVTSRLWQALVNKPFGSLQVVRAAAAAAATANRSFSDAVPTAIVRVDATSPGIWGNNVTIDIAAATDGVSSHFDLTATYLGKAYLYRNLDVSASGIDNTLAAIGTDEGNVIKVTKLANGRPVNVAAAPLGAGGGTVGTEGTIVDSDFTASSRGVNVLANTPGISVVFIAERSSSTLRSYMATLAATATDRMFLICPDSDATSTSTAISDTSSIRADRLIYCFNNPYTLDPDAGAEIVTHPTSWMASILSQTDVDIHPGEEDTKIQTAGIIRLTYPALSRTDYISLRNAGISALENNDGFQFVSGVTTSLTTGRTEITRRRMADYLQLSIASTLRFSVKKKNTFSRRTAIAGMVQQFLDDLQRAERVVLRSQVDINSLNTAAQEAQGITRCLIRVQLINHILSLVLETEIGTTVQIAEIQ